MAAKALGLLEATTLVVGAMIGSGILILPGLMIAEARSPWLVVIALAAGGVLSAMGALVVAELAAMFPRAGGQYQYLREGLSPVWGYLFGWGMLWIVLTGILAGVAAAFAGFVDALLSLPGEPRALVVGSWDTRITLPGWGSAYVAIALIWALAGLNYLGAKVGGWISNVTTIAKYVGLLALVVLLLAFGERAPDAFLSAAGPTAFAGVTLVGFAAALAFGLFAFDGWVAVTYIASEVRDAPRNLPIALVVGPLVVAAIYVLLTISYFVALPAADGVAIGERGGLIAVEAALRAVGPGAATFIAVVGIVSLAGTANAFVLAVPRVFHAMASDGALFASVAKLSGKGRVPANAMILLAWWSSLLVLSGLYASLVYMVVFGQWLFYLLTVVAHMRLRRTRPAAERPFRTPLHPIVPATFLLASAFIVLSLLGQDEQRPYALFAIGLLALGVPFYHVQRAAARRREAAGGGDPDA